MDATAAEGAQDRATAGPGKIGTYRRAFCLLALFDLIFTCILWIFYTRILGLSLDTAFSNQVLRYNFNTSVFDLVVLSLFRFVLLESFYALLRVKNPWIVAVTTALSTAFVIVKIILYDYADSRGAFDYLMPIMSLMLVWMETFFLDCKVLPVERADELIQSLSSERSALLGYGSHFNGYGGGGSSHNRQHSVVPSEGFVTPDSSPEHSDDEGAQQPRDFPPNPAIPENERSHFVQRAVRLAEEAWQYLEDPGWRCVQEGGPMRILSQKSHYRPSGKAWRLELLVGIPAERMFQEFWDRVDRQADWNRTVQFSRLIARLDTNTAVVYNATVETGGGLIKARDFVTLCVRRLRDGVRYTGGVSIDTVLVPRSDKYTRGENHPGCIACAPHGVAGCRVVWIVDSDIKGWLPTRVIDQAMSSVLSQLGASILQLASSISQAETPTV